MARKLGGLGIEGPIDYHLFKERNAAMTIPFDTLGYATKLEQAGVPAAQAAEEAKILADVLSSPVAFQGDVAALALQSIKDNGSES